MKKLHQLCIAVVFTLAFTTTAFAGDIHTGGLTQEPPEVPSETTPTDIGTGGIQNPEGISDSVADIALDLLQTMLSVF